MSEEFLLRKKLIILLLAWLDCLTELMSLDAGTVLWFDMTTAMFVLDTKLITSCGSSFTHLIGLDWPWLALIFEWHPYSKKELIIVYYCWLKCYKWCWFWSPGWGPSIVSGSYLMELILNFGDGYNPSRAGGQQRVHVWLGSVRVHVERSFGVPGTAPRILHTYEKMVLSTLKKLQAFWFVKVVFTIWSGQSMRFHECLGDSETAATIKISQVVIFTYDFEWEVEDIAKDTRKAEMDKHTHLHNRDNHDKRSKYWNHCDFNACCCCINI